MNPAGAVAAVGALSVGAGWGIRKISGLDEPMEELGETIGVWVGGLVYNQNANTKGERNKTARPDGTNNPNKHFRKRPDGRWEYIDPHSGKKKLKPRNWTPPDVCIIPVDISCDEQ